MTPSRRHMLVLSLYCNTRGFAFVLFEGPLSPFDWGIQEVRGARKQARCLTRLTAILDRYTPDVVVVQDSSPQGTRRALRITRLNAEIVEMAERRGIPVYAYSRAEVLRLFQSTGHANKQILAELIAKHIPAFDRYVPPPRKPWKSEDARMGLFDAAALALSFYSNQS